MITSHHIEDVLTKFIKYQALAGKPLTPETDLLEANVLDSLLLMDLTLYVESTYGIQLDDADISPQNFRTIDRLARLVERKVLAAREVSRQRNHFVEDLGRLRNECDTSTFTS